MYLDRPHREPRQPLDLVGDAVADAGRDLGEVEPVFDHHVQVDSDLLAVAADLDAAWPAARARDLSAQRALHSDHAVALERRLRDDLRDRVGRDRDPPEWRGKRVS